jgi:hypothetical protein
MASEAISKIIKLEYLFSKNKIKYILTTHTVFINYGLIALVGRKFNSKIKIIYPENNYKNIRVLDVDKKTLVQIDKYYEYKKEFQKIENKKICYKASENEIKKRIYKNISNEKVSYVSAYDKSNIPIFNSTKPKIIILPSCFYDAHHFFRYSLFKDVTEWLEFTLYHASKTNFEWYVKPHPASHKMNYKIYEKLKLKYKTVNFLNPNVSNLAFQKNNFCSMFTFQSSAVHEFAFMNIPSVIVTDNVSVNYSFGKPIMNKNRYRFMIYNADKIKKEFNYKDILEFNYMWRFNKSSSFKNYNLSTEPKKNMKNNLNSFKDSFDLINNFLKNKNYQYKLSKISLDIFK